MKHFFLSPIMVVEILILAGMLMNSCDNNKKLSTTQSAKIYVANEEGGNVSVIDLHMVWKGINMKYLI